MPQTNLARRKGLVVSVMIIVFAVYCAWMIGPYLQSILIRDAAVTSWSRTVTSPIAGEVTSEMPNAAAVIGEDGHVATVVNDRLFDKTAAIGALQARIDHAAVKRDEAGDIIEGLEALRQQRESRTRRYAEVFRAELATTVETLQSEIAITERRMEILGRLLSRQRELRQRNVAADAAVDESELRLSELESARERLSSNLAYARIRQQAAEDGVFIEEDGSDPNWSQQTDFALERQLLEARARKRDAEQEARELNVLLTTAKQEFERLSKAEIVVPAGAVIESVQVTAGETVSAGDVLLRWVDCAVLLVDVPVSDAELPLIRPGMRAEVVMEGESDERDATVMLTRGAAATLGRDDLASIAKGRQDGVAQVIVRLDAENREGECPVGRAAYVGFPDVGFLDVISARLRL
ncbi:MAG: HlyD family efflux transporter periplasmic adaptor subunit [Pseudomonadota bacterium]